jgi:hypothetical protein
MYRFGILKPYIGQAVDGELDLMVLFGGVEERAAIHLEMNMWLKERGDDIFFSSPHQSAPSNPTRHLVCAVYKASKNAQPLHTHPEDGNCSVCRNIG